MKRTDRVEIRLGGERLLRLWLIRGEDGTAERLVIANARLHEPMWLGSRTILPPAAIPTLLAELARLEQAVKAAG